MLKRISFDVILFISIFIFPWWISAFLVLSGVFLFNNFYEFIGASVIAYSLYAIPSDRLISSPVLFAIIISILYIAIQYFKSNIILYKK